MCPKMFTSANAVRPTILLSVMEITKTLPVNNIFYLYAIFFIVRCIRGIYNAKKNSIEQEEVLKNVEVFTLDSDRRKKDIDYISFKLKRKSRWSRLFSIVDFFWTIAGIFISVESHAFILLLIVEMLSRFLPLYFKRRKQLNDIIVISRVLEILTAMLILHHHFLPIAN